MWVYYNGTIMPKDQVAISPDDRGFLFGDGVYEVLGANQGHFLAEDAHYDRLVHSLSALRIPIPDLNAIKTAVGALLERNALLKKPAKVYMQFTRGVAPRGHAFPDTAIPPTVYITVTAYVPPVFNWLHGVKAILLPDLRWGRCDIKSLNLLPNVLASQQAKEVGAYDAILHRDGVITEGSHTCVCGVRNGVVFFHPLSPHVLPSITRALVIQLCQTEGIPVKEKAIRLSTLPHLDELMLLGTTTEVMPVIEIDGKPVGSGIPGPLTHRLQQAFRTLVLSQSG